MYEKTDNEKFLDRKIERYLRDYKNYKISIKNLEKQLEYIMPSITSSYEYREGNGGTFSIYSKTENVAIDRLESSKALFLNEEKEQKKLIVEAIDNALSVLEKEEIEFIKNRYFEGYRIKEIAARQKCSESYLHDIRRRALDQLKISLIFLLM